MGVLRAVFEIETGVERTRQRLRARDQRPTTPSPVAIVLLVVLLRLFLHVGLDDLLDIPDLDQDVLRLQVRVDDAAFPVQVVQAEEHLFRDLLHQRHRDTAVIPSLDQAQQILPQNFEYHADVDTIGALVFEGIEEADDMFATGVRGLRLDDAVEEFDLVDGGFGVVGSGSDDLEGDVFPRGGIAGQPDG